MAHAAGTRSPIGLRQSCKRSKSKKNYLLLPIARYTKLSSVKIANPTGGKILIKFLCTHIDTHGIPKSIKTDQLRTIKRRLGVMFLEEIVASVMLYLSTINKDMRWTKQKTIQQSPFKTYFGRLRKTEFKRIRVNFFLILNNLC